MKIHLLVFICIVVNCYAQVEIDHASVSTMYVQKKDTSYLSKYSKIKQLFHLEKYDDSLKSALALLESIEGKNELELAYKCNFLIGNILRKRYDHKKSLRHFQKALALLYQRAGSTDVTRTFSCKGFERNNPLAEILLRIGGVFSILQEQDSAEVYFKKIFEIPSLGSYSDIKASAYSNLSGIYQMRGEYQFSEEFAQKAIDIHKYNNNRLLEAGSMGNLASIYLDQKQYVKAKELYADAIGLIQSDTNTTAMDNKEDLYYNLAYTLYLQKDYTSYDYLRQSYAFKDTLVEREYERMVKGVYAEYQERYNVKLLKNKVKLEKAAKTRTIWFFGLFACMVIATSVVVFYGYRLRQKNLKLTLVQTKLAQKRKLEKLRSESQVRILNATLDGKETERKQIAETLHDSVSSMLSSASLHLQATKMQFIGELPQEIDKTQKILVEASEVIRDLSHTLVSSVLLKFGLKYAIEDMAQKYSNSKIEIRTDIQDIERLKQNFEIKVYHIIQEFVNNILKHSNASKAIVRIAVKSGKLIVIVEDNGIGFDRNSIPEKDGLGINQIDARIQMMKGYFRIDSNPKDGTKVVVKLPML